MTDDSERSRRLVRSAFLAATLVALACLGACGGGGSEPGPGPDPTQLQWDEGQWDQQRWG